MIGDGAGVKVVTAGTHRTRTAEETWAWIKPMLSEVGITRVADVTRLDYIGIPVFLAVRPDSRNLSLSQGKGLSPALARVSAAMESIETWHAEAIASQRHACLREIERDLTYDVSKLDAVAPSLLHPDLTIGWTQALSLVDGTATWLPTELLLLDFKTNPTWHRSIFLASSNGLASGNSRDEALLHALLELLERDCEARAALNTLPLIDPVTVDRGYAQELMAQLLAADVKVMIRDQTGPTGIPCYSAEIWSDDLPSRFGGSGCHTDPDVAMCRALSEAAQSRLTNISGARDDMSDKGFRWSRRPVPITADKSATAQPWDCATQDVTTIQVDLAKVVSAIAKLTGFSPLMIDLTSPELMIPVVKAVAPGLRATL